MHAPDLEILIRETLATAYQTDDGATEIEYQETFKNEGARKAKYIIEDLLLREKQGQFNTADLVYLSIGGADGSEIEHVLRSTHIKHGIMVEVDDRAADEAKSRAKELSTELGKEFRVITGDVTAKLQEISTELGSYRKKQALSGIVCSAQAVLHELPRRSPGFNFSVFFGTIYKDPSWQTVAFYSREPCIPPNWPPTVEVRIENVSGDSLRQFAIHVADRLGLLQRANDLPGGWVQVSGIVAVELLHKLLRNDTIRKIKYELEEQLTAFNPRLVETILKNHVPGMDVRLKYETTAGFREAVESHDVQFRDPDQNELAIPVTHVRITAIRARSAQQRDGVSLATAGLIDAARAEQREPSNLGAAPYSRFIPREQYFAEITEALTERRTPVIVTGMSGVGKTSLAYEVASNCLTGEARCPQFDAVVWVSDKENPGFTTLSSVLDEIAWTLDYAGLAQLGLPEKRRRIEELARSQKILVIIDSFETIVDSSLSKWLCNLPEPSKALVTTLKRDAQFPDTVTEVQVLGMNEAETREFVEHRLSALKLISLVQEYSKLAPLLDITKGNPKAIEIALGIIKRKKRPLFEVVESLAEAKPPFDSLCLGAWNLLDEQARQLLLSTHYFPFGAKDDSLRQVAQLDKSSFDRAAELLYDLGQLDVIQEDVDSPPIYSTHGLVSAFVGARLKAQTDINTALRGNWLAYIRGIVSGIGLCWDDITKLHVLDDQRLRQTVLLAIEWSFQHKEYESTIAIARGVRYYFYVRGFWSMDINLRRAEAAKLSGDASEEFAALTYHVNIASKQRNLIGIQAYLDRLHQLSQLHQVSHENMIAYQHALALYALASGEYDKAEEIWLQNLEQIVSSKFPHEFSANTRWLAVCYENQGRISEAHELLKKALVHAAEMNFTRGVVDIALKQATLYLSERRFDEISLKLKEIEASLKNVQDRMYDAQYSYLDGQVSDAKGQASRAKVLYEKALDSFERLGLNDPARKVKVALEDLMNRYEILQDQES